MPDYNENPDIVLIGAGIMSATLGMLLKELDPSLTIEIIERLDHAAAESSDAWNNAGTGHSAFCELNYTPQRPDGSVDITKAIRIAESFEQSRQFWAFLTQHEFVELPNTFIRSIPHMSFVWGGDNVEFLKKRFEAMQQSVLFQEMQYSEDHQQLVDWMPLIMQGRDPAQKVAATYMPLGTDVNFGALTRAMFHCLREMEGVTLHFNEEVHDLDRAANRREKDKRWKVSVRNRDTRERRKIYAKFVFIGAGGGSLPLLLKSGIPEGRGYGGFPVSGQWLRCTNPDVIARHHAKVYGKAEVGSPPMSVPHLDSRMIKGKQELLFGPYAGFSTKFLKKGSFFDLPFSVNLRNIRPMIAAGLHNIPLTKYLIEQVRQSPDERLDALEKYYPEAKLDDWELEIAGQRVQVIKHDEEEGGILEFGTEVVSSADGSLAALLGASPGASTAVSIMLGLLERCFPEQLRTEAWQQKLREMIPSYGQSLGDDPALCREVRKMTSKVLDLAEAEQFS
ncbi:malate:quinone oxidoreductase [Persicitalea jodogahamensis]|uniref:Probable malate:quinone oxidoreductase n=1 Tax=Persicitalea jodogahamensis TaxID=402147 RepID=A0A8J3D725_9BACT|nr:malate:quinone oxidoreductase [Persicitalea jodogahamensis]GHB83440.1 putative malate:quinone oxidoreductase [Persicitalea jodogahamensis]